MKAERFWPAVGDAVWDRIRDEFTLPDLAVEARFFELTGNPAPLMRQLIRVFIGDGVFCPGFQFREGLPDPAAVAIFGRAMDLAVPHNVFAAWMITPMRSAGNKRPVDALGDTRLLESELAAFADWYRPRPSSG
ncbi:hypothetical protein [Arthrobacter sp. UYCo732]|uniref:hypothetical protein n=1 Tax=Arthrobacter sp. UYCo732 TaxID=3156336 RepID=UPI00339A6F50